jgi:hypothetical protein
VTSFASLEETRTADQFFFDGEAPKSLKSLSDRVIGQSFRCRRLPRRCKVAEAGHADIVDVSTISRWSGVRPENFEKRECRSKLIDVRGMITLDTGHSADHCGTNAVRSDNFRHNADHSLFSNAETARIWPRCKVRRWLQEGFWWLLRTA